ncbi:MAG: nicotinamide-nucleotide amidohydrolase family protein [Leptospiraceae bacterium]|nr:nicotinamide-nucleotide amidohydrolase family protein [Leptospiraceae bacterium]
MDNSSNARQRQVFIISTGTELSSGRSTDTNAPEIAAAFSADNWTICGFATLPDDPQLLKSALQHALSSMHVDLIVMTGGLGPTEDDHTIAVLSALSGKAPVEDRDARRKIEILFKRRRRVISDAKVFRQARTLVDAVVLPNKNGLAPGSLIAVEHQGHQAWIAAMPGVPSEMRAMLHHELLPRLRKLVPAPAVADLEYFYVYDTPESVAESMLFHHADTRLAAESLPPDLEWGITARAGYNKFFIKSTDQRALLRIQNHARKLFGEKYSVRDILDLLPDLLKQHKWSIGLAESCTGGLIGKIVTDQAGSSAWFQGSIVSYSNAAKKELLQVPESILQQYGAVSAECALEMARGAKAALDSDYSLSITGIAGPDGGSIDKPVGTVYICVYFNDDDYLIHLLNNPPDRERVREHSAHKALFYLLRFAESHVTA